MREWSESRKYNGYTLHRYDRQVLNQAQTKTKSGGGLVMYIGND